jgi:hypothetical protein
MEMEIRNQLFTEKEQKLLRKMEKGNQEIQYISSYGGKFLVSFGNSFLQTRSVILLNVWDGNKSCSGHLGEKIFSTNNLENGKNNEPFSVFIDRRLDDEIRIHVKEGDKSRTQSTADLQNTIDHVLLTFIEDNKNAQLIIFDGKLNEKIAQLVATKEEFRDKLRFFAMSYVSKYFPNIFNDGVEEYGENKSN